MIRAVLVAVLLAVMCIVLYVPSTMPAERFMELLRQEHASNREAWGAQAADRTLARMLDTSQWVRQAAAPAPPAVQAGQHSRVDQPVVASFEAMSNRLFRNEYFRSIDALLLVVIYRLSQLVELAPLLLCLFVLGTIDALAVRKARMRQLEGKSAEVFAVQVIAAIVTLAAACVAVFLPMQLPAWLLSSCTIVATFALTRSVASYHTVR